MAGPAVTAIAVAAPAPAAPTSTSGLLETGDRGPAVQSWQERLDAWRASQGLGTIAADGVFGAGTRDATEQFQRAAGIAIDGIVGPQSDDAMELALGSDVPDCTFTQLTTTADHLPGAAGHTGYVLRFSNHSAQACSLYGYPGVAGLDASGDQVSEATRMLRGYMGGLPAGDDAPATVVLLPSESASARVEGTDVPIGTQPCPHLSGMLVTAPNDYQATRLGDAPGDCSGLVVTPVVQGTAGGTP